MTHGTEHWGGWQYDPETLVLKRREYEVDLEHCQTSAAMLDWIIQVAGKSWATDGVLAGLVRALDDLLEPQANLCSGEVERGPIDVKRVLKAKTRSR